MGKRKRSHTSDNVKQDLKRAKVESNTTTLVKHPALRLYYRNILTLRDYLLLKLPTTSKLRRRRIASISPHTAELHDNDEEISTLSQDRRCLSRLLDKTLVCAVIEQTPVPESSRIKDFEAFSQHVSPTAGSSISGNTSSLSDLVDYAISRLFHKTHRNTHKPPHMLCHGFQRAGNQRQTHDDHCAVAGIPGIVSFYPNANVNVLKGSCWTEILALLGKEGERILLDLLLDCGVFVAGEEGLGNYYQLSGIGYLGVLLLLNLELTLAAGTPLTELQPLGATSPYTRSTFSRPERSNTSTICHVPRSAHKTPAAITFVRNRMFYARAALNAKGRVTFGLRHIREFGNLHQYVSLMCNRCLESISR